MAQNTKSVPGTKNSPQTILNHSFDEDFQVLAVEQLSHNPITDTLERVETMQGNPSTVITGLSSSGDNLTLQKTIGATTYTKTLVYSGSGPYTLTISSWEI